MNDEELQAVFDAIQKAREMILDAIDKETEASISRRVLSNALRTELADIQMIIHAKMKDAEAEANE